MKKKTGRVYSKRAMGAKLRFYDLRSESQKVQVMANANFYHDQDEFVKITERIKLGDIVGVKGQPCRTKTGELSIRPSQIIILTPCLHQMPHMHYGLKDKVRLSCLSLSHSFKIGLKHRYHSYSYINRRPDSVNAISI